MSGQGSEARTTGLRVDDTALDQVLDLLGPRHTKGSPAGQQWAVLPHRAKPRYLVPVRPRRVTAATRLRTSRYRLGQRAESLVGALVRSGAARVYPVQAKVGVGDEHSSLVEMLRARFDRADLQVAVALGRPRVNRKPVLQLIDGDGTTLAFGKLGVDAHTDELVARESHFLTEHGGARPPLLLPRPLLIEEWRGHQLLVINDLGAGIDGTGMLDLTAATVSAIAALGPTEHAPPLDSTWWTQTEERINALPDTTGPLLERCRDHLHRVLDKVGDQPWPFGTWHGDLARWNAVQRGSSFVVWDWERARGPVPVGLDAVHAHFQPPVLMQGRTGPEAASLALAGAGAILSDLGYHDAGEAVVAAYLLELRLRLAEDETMGALGDVRWYADEVTDAALEWKP
jgi:hypothetical protein